MQAVLVMFRSDGERRSFSVVRDITVVGRREDCDLRIPLGDVSRKHCRLVREGDSIRLEDLGSSNGTYHNGQRVEREAMLGPGDSIQVGPVVFVLQLDGVPGDDELHPITTDAASPSYQGETSQESYQGEEGGAMAAAPSMPSPPPMPIPPAGGDELDPLEMLDDADGLQSLPAGADPTDSVALGTGGGVEELEALPLDEAEAAPADADNAGFDIMSDEMSDEPHGGGEGGQQVGDEGHLDLDQIDFDAEHPHK